MIEYKYTYKYQGNPEIKGIIVQTASGRYGVGSPAYRYTYHGQEHDGEVGFEAFGLRSWDARIGRWKSPDLYGQYHSTYLGMGNNPVVTVDPDGGFTFLHHLAFTVGGALIGAGVGYLIDKDDGWKWGAAIGAAAGFGASFIGSGGGNGMKAYKGNALKQGKAGTVKRGGMKNYMSKGRYGGGPEIFGEYKANWSRVVIHNLKDQSWVFAGRWMYDFPKVSHLESDDNWRRIRHRPLFDNYNRTKGAEYKNIEGTIILGTRDYSKLEGGYLTLARGKKQINWKIIGQQRTYVHKTFKKIMGIKFRIR